MKPSVLGEASISILSRDPSLQETPKRNGRFWKRVVVEQNGVGHRGI